MITITPAPFDADLGLAATLPSGSASVAVWWTRVPPLAGERLGVIGAFSADCAEAAVAVLAEAEARLRAQGCTLAIGPMDGNTWRRYRLVTDAGTEPPFLLEPANPAAWPEWWRAAGFGPLAEYYSTASDDLSARDERVEGVRARLTKAGVTIRKLDMGRFEAELEKIYEVSVVSFMENYLYTPLPKDAFLAQYAAIRERVRPELVLLAECGGRPVGYVFAIPDYAQAARGHTVDTFIVKTLAVLPGRAYAGLGAWLLDEAHGAARALGFKRVIHALMHEGNKSRNLSSHYARTIRRYTLFSKRLGQGRKVLTTKHTKDTKVRTVESGEWRQSCRRRPGVATEGMASGTIGTPSYERRCFSEWLHRRQPEEAQRARRERLTWFELRALCVGALCSL